MPFALTVKVGLPLTDALVIVLIAECDIVRAVLSALVMGAVLTCKRLFGLPCLKSSLLVGIFEFAYGERIIELLVGIRFTLRLFFVKPFFRLG